MFRNGKPSDCGDRKTFEVMTSTYQIGTLCTVACLLAAILYQETHDWNKLWNIVSTERDILHIQALLECCYMESSQWEN